MATQLFADPLQGVIQGMLEAHDIKQQLQRAKIAQQREQMLVEDHQRQQEDSARQRQREDADHLMKMEQSGAQRVTGGVVPDPVTGSFDMLRKADPGRLARYKTADGRTIEHEIPTYLEQTRRADERARAQAGLAIETTGKTKGAQLAAEAPYKQHDLEAKAVIDKMLKTLEGDNAMTLAKFNQGKQGERQDDAQAHAVELEKDRAKTQEHLMEMRNRGRMNAAVSGRGEKYERELAERQGLVKTIMANPQLYDELGVEQKGKIAADLAAAGFTGFGKQMGSTDVRKLGESRGAIDELRGLKDVLTANERYIGPIAGLQALNPYSDARQAQAKIDLVKQRVGKALEGGVLRKEDEEKYKKILATLRDEPETAIYKVNSLIQSIENDMDAFTRAQRGAGRKVDGSANQKQGPANDPLGLRAADPLGVR